MKPEKITILNNKKEKLVGYLYKNTSKKIVIMCHGALPMIGYPGMDEALLYYYRAGTSVFAFDFSGHGESDGEKRLGIEQRVKDLGEVIAYFSKDYKEIMLYGYSLGAMSVAIAANTYKNISKLIFVNGFFSLAPQKLSMKQNMSILLYLLTHPNMFFDVFYWIKNFRPREITVPTLVVYSENDKEVKQTQSLHFFEKLQCRKKLIMVHEGDHALMDKNLWPQLYPILDWIKE